MKEIDLTPRKLFVCLFEADDGESGENAYLSPSSMLDAARICIQEGDGVPKIKVRSEDERLRLQIKKILTMPSKPGESANITDK